MRLTGSFLSMLSVRKDVLLLRWHVTWIARSDWTEKTKVVASSLVTRNHAFSLAEFRSHFSSQISNATFKMESRQDHTEFLTKSNTKEIWLNLKVKTLYLYFNLLNKDSTMFGESKYLKVLCFDAKKLTKSRFFLLKFCFFFANFCL